MFGLFKDDDAFKEGIVVPDTFNSNTITFNGYKFYDSYFAEGSSFNYSLTGGDGLETRRTGLTASGGDFIGNPSIYYVKFGKLSRDNFTSLKYPFDITTTYLNPTQVLYRDGGVFMINDDTFNSATYFSLSYDGGSFTDRPRLSGDNGVEQVDGCLFISDIPSIEDSLSLFDLELFNSVDPKATTIYTNITSNNLSLTERKDLDGGLYVKNANDEVMSFKDALPYLSKRYSSSVYAELLSSVRDFDIVYNVYLIQTNNYLVIDKIDYIDNTFSIPKTNSSVVSYNTDLFNKISNRFLVKRSVYFSLLSSVGVTQEIIPIIYRYNLDYHKLDRIYPNSTYTSGDFEINDADCVYYEADTPVITYSEDVNMFNLSYLLKDQNKSPYLISINFQDYDEIVIKDVTGFVFKENKNTITFNVNTNFSTFTPIISSSTPTLSTFSIIL
jgi:hypothetical protein